jgi:hypothetical protein
MNIRPLDIITADGTAIPTASVELTLGGTTYLVPMNALFLGGTDGAQVIPVSDAEALALLDVLVTNQGKVLPLDYAASTTGTVAAGGGTLVSAGAMTRSLTITTLSDSVSNIWLDPNGGTPAVGKGVLLFAGGGDQSFGEGAPRPMPTGAITAISENGFLQLVSLVGG